MRPIDAALSYAERGWKVLPCHSLTDDCCTCGKKGCQSPGKHPWTKNGLTDATTDEPTIRKWWEMWPDANPAIATGPDSGLGVLDVDDREEFDAYCQETGYDPGSTPTVMTRNDGLHYYFATTDPVFRNWAKKIPGCDFRGDRGYVIAPAPGNGYQFAPYLGPDDVALAPLPAWLAEVGSSDSSRAERVDPSAVLDGIPKGERNDSLFRYACRLVSKGLEADEVARIVGDAAAKARPPLPPTEVQALLASALKFRPNFHCTDLGNAERFLATCRDRVRYCAPWARWLVWDGRRWGVDDVQRVRSMAGEVARSIWREAADETDPDRRKALGKWAASSESRQRIEAMLSLASCAEEIAIRPEDLDRDLWALNCGNGTVDLRIGKLRPHNPADLLSMLAAVDFNTSAECHRWKRFLREIFLDDTELIEFIQRTIGYCLTGDTREQVLWIHHGLGANGKSVFFDVLDCLLGDYSARADFATFAISQGDGPRNDIARLRGKRLVLASESEAGVRLAQSLIKQLTGQEKVTARFLYQEAFEFLPAFKIHMASNHKPQIRGNDFATWRRLRLVPYLATFAPEDQDKELGAKLKAELPGILAWAVRGCLAWQREGLGVPEAVSAATEQYKTEEDVLAEFVAERCVLGDQYRIAQAELFKVYRTWADENSLRAVGSATFARNLESRGIGRVTVRGKRTLTGIKLTPEGWNDSQGGTLDPVSGKSREEKIQGKVSGYGGQGATLGDPADLGILQKLLDDNPSISLDSLKTRAAGQGLEGTRLALALASLNDEPPRHERN